MFLLILIILHNSVILFCKSEWVEISQGNNEKFSSNKPKNVHKNGNIREYTFPRNEYSYTPSNLGKKDKFHEFKTKTTSTTTEEVEEVTTTSIPSPIPSSLETVTNSSANPPTSSTVFMDRMDKPTLTSTESEAENPDQTTTFKNENGENPKLRIPRIKNKTFVNPAPRLNSFMNFLKRIQDDLMEKTHYKNSLRGKINMLKNLRDEILLNIDEKVNSLWGRRNDVESSSSEARGHKDEEEYDMHFPSNEGALMTIGFLTFAVFLIKLILKLVQAIKEKHSVTMMMPTMMTNAALIGKRRKREVEYENQNEILSLIDDFKANLK